MYNDSAVHSVPAIINLMSNGLMAAASGITDQVINVFSYPWPQTTSDRGWDNAAFTSTLIIAMAFVLIPGGFGIDVVRDRQVCKVYSVIIHPVLIAVSEQHM